MANEVSPEELELEDPIGPGEIPEEFKKEEE